MRLNAVPVLSQKDASRDGVPEPFFPGITTTNTTSLRPNFGSLFAFRNFFQKKMALVTPKYKYHRIIIF
jgi:hypothetical protein